MTTVHVNGKFTARRTTGVERVAHNLLRAVDRLLGEGTGSANRRWILWCPPDVQSPALRHIEVRSTGSRRWGLHVWEQLALPRAAGGGLLLNLAGSAPFRAARQACVLHDAAVFDVPQAYRRRFRWWYRMLFRHLARQADALLTVSAFSRQRLCACLGISSERVVVVGGGADHLSRVVPDDRVLDAMALRGRRFVLAVGSTNPAKNLAVLEQAFAKLPDRQLRLVLVGGGNVQVFGKAPASVRDERILRAGVLDDAQLVALYRHATVLAHPSLYEGFGLPPLEAMGFGCPVVAADAAALPEVCGDAALYVDPTDPAALAAALSRVIDDAALRERLADAGRQRAATHTWNAAARALMEALPA